MQTLNPEMIYKNAAEPVTLMSNDESKSKPQNGDYCSLSIEHRDGDVVLRDGSTIRVRPMHPEDDQGLFDLFQSLSEESRWLRFFSMSNGTALAAEARREVNLDRTFGLIALSGANERVVGHAFYAELEANRAEVAFTIADDFQGRGLGTILLGQLAEVAVSRGIQTVCDVAALEDGLLRVSAMVEDLPQIAELDCNPFVVQQDGAVILDARVRVEAVEPRPLLGVRN